MCAPVCRVMSSVCVCACFGVHEKERGFKNERDRTRITGERLDLQSKTERTHMPPGKRRKGEGP